MGRSATSSTGPQRLAKVREEVTRKEEIAKAAERKKKWDAKAREEARRLEDLKEEEERRLLQRQEAKIREEEGARENLEGFKKEKEARD